MITDDITINLSPYLGCSKHLIEFFAIIGYEEEVIKSFGMDFMEHQDQLELTILSLDAADISYEIATDYIIKQVYPDKPTIKENERPPSDSIIFSSCIDSVNGDNKIFYSCYAFRFYEKIKLDKKYYVPKIKYVLKIWDFDFASINEPDKPGTVKATAAKAPTGIKTKYSHQFLLIFWNNPIMFILSPKATDKTPRAMTNRAPVIINII